MKNMINNHRAQTGSILLVSLVILIVLSIMGLTSMRSSQLELRMAGNEQVQVVAHQAAQSLIDMVVDNPATTPVIGDVGFVLCSDGNTNPDCNMFTISSAEAVGAMVNDMNTSHLSASAELTAIGPPPRGSGFSADLFVGNHYAVNAVYDRSDEGLGRSSITQGVIVITQESF